MYRLLLQLVMLVCVATAWELHDQLESDAIIQAVNAAHTTWTAGRNFHTSLKKNYLKHLVDTNYVPVRNELPKYVPQKHSRDLPTEFDSRHQWPDCKTISQIQDQGACASGWAVAATSAVSDRLCISYNSTLSLQLSAENLLSCCTDCSVQGCKQGVSWKAWVWMNSDGVVTGGSYKSKSGCQPYLLPPCDHHAMSQGKNCSMKSDIAIPACKTNCYNKEYKTPYIQDFHRLISAYGFGPYDTPIQEDITIHGPVEADMDVYEDFLSYKSGVYQHKTGQYLGQHSVKLIGWGVGEDDTPYWLASNSWNTDWGHKGFFKIKRGSNECKIEENVFGGVLDSRQVSTL